MHVGLNLVFLVPGETGGMEIYARELAPALAQVAPGIRITAFINREAADEGLDLGPGVETVVVPVRARNRLQWVLGEQLQLPPLARRRGVEVLHSLASTSPGRGRFVRVTTLHDLNYRHFPETHFGLRAYGMRLLVPLTARRSHRLITASRAAAADIRELLGVSPERIDVVPHGFGDLPRQRAQPESEVDVRRRWDVGSRQLVLTLSAKRPSKNLERLLEAMQILPASRRPVLVMPGYPTPYEETLRRRVEELGLDADVRLPGWIPATQVEGLWRVATCFAFPSLYEGFGAPVPEAMRRGVPVACSDRSSLPEVAGDAALLFDPEQPAAIAAALDRLLGEPELRQELIRRGYKQADRFSWTGTAEMTLASYERAIADVRAFGGP